MIATVRPFELALTSPLQTARGTIDTREGFLFDVFDDPMGLGEATPIPPFTEDRTASHDALQEAATAYTDHGWREAFEAVSGPENGRLRFPAARHAVSLAYLEQRARQAYQPLYRHLGRAEAAGTVPVNATIGDHPADETASRAEDAVEEGFPAVKIKVGNRAVAEDADRVRAVRSAVPEDIDVRVDANGAWTQATAGKFVDQTADLALDYVEQPLDPDDLSGHRELRGSGVDIALDESIAIQTLDAVMAADAADVYVVKPMAVGGVDVARGAAVHLRKRDHRVIFSSTIDSVVARTGAVHAAASLPDVPPSGLATADFLEEDLAEDPAPVADGEIALSDAPGLGIQDVDI